MENDDESQQKDLLLQSSGPPERLVKLARETFEALRAANYEMRRELEREIDAHRSGAGKKTYNAARRAKYAEKVASEGQTVRAYGAADSEAKKQRRTDANTARMRAKRQAQRIAAKARQTNPDA